MKKMTCLAIMIVAVCMSTQTFAQKNMGAKNGVPMWSVPDPVPLELTGRKIDSLLKLILLKAPKIKVEGANYIKKENDDFTYKSLACEIRPDDNAYSIYLFSDNLRCVVSPSGKDGRSDYWVKLSTLQQDVTFYDSGGKSIPFFVSAVNPDLTFVTKGMATAESVLSVEAKRYP